MKRQATSRLRWVGLALAASIGIGAAVAAPPSRQEAAREQDRIETAYETERKACDALAGNRKDVCVERAKAHRDVAAAALEARRSDSEQARVALEKARVKADFEVAKERCDDLAGNAKDVCLKQADADRTRRLSDIELRTEIATARDAASRAKNDAEYRLAVERCDALSGAARQACVDEAKARHGRS